VRPGFVADLVLIEGDPLTDIALMTDRGRIRAVMKEGRLFRPRARPSDAREPVDLEIPS
jgi:imidazolonepropionase-like amidohydrolase